MAFISPDVAVALVRATLAICGDRATGYPDQPGVRWGLRHPRRRRRKGKAILLLIIGIYTVSYLSLFILFVYLPPGFIITTRSDCYYTDFVFCISCFVFCCRDGACPVSTTLDCKLINFQIIIAGYGAPSGYGYGAYG